MIGAFLILSLVGLGLFYVQNLLLFPHIYLSLVSLLVFYVSLRPSLPLAFFVAVFLGLVQDSYALTPLGIHVSSALVLVAAGRYARRRFLFASPVPQILACLVVLALQEASLRLTLLLVGYRHFIIGDLARMRGLEILCTAAVAPLIFTLLNGLDKAMKQLGWRSLNSSYSQ